MSNNINIDNLLGVDAINANLEEGSAVGCNLKK